MIRQSIFFLFAGLFAAGAAAYDYPTITFETTDGTAHSIAVDNLTLSFSELYMTAVGKEDTFEIPLADLSKMFFNVGESGVNSSLNRVEGPVNVYTLSGIEVGVFDSLSEVRNTLPGGVYIIKTEDKVFKICVK